MKATETTIDNIKISYEMGGKGFPLVFLHGFCEDKTMWSGFSDQFQDKYTVLNIDLPGFGASGLMPSPSIAQMAKCVNGVLAQHDIRQCILTGHSMGGYTALEFTEKYPEKLAGLCLFHSHPFADTEEKKLNRKKAADFVDRNGTRLFIREVIPNLFAPSFKANNRDLILKLITHATQLSKKAISGALKAMANRKDHCDTLRKATCPVLFIAGDEDSVVTMDQNLEQVHLPKIADIQIMRGVGHMGMYERREETLEMISDFVQFALDE